MKGKLVLVTGGASFISSHLVDTLLRDGAEVRVADDFSSGKLENLEYPLTQKSNNEWVSKNLSVFIGDLKEKTFTKKMVEDVDVVFHMAALHGGRGYIESHPAECCSNMILDQLVFEESCRAGVDRICFASSACVYPSYLQDHVKSDYLLKEDDANPFQRDRAFADLEYGWAKLMGEMALKAYYKEHGMKTASVRIFTAYGPRENETHAIIALIAKAFIKMDPFIIWGSGEQDRNFTYVQDIVDSLILASKSIFDGSAVNSGRNDRLTINQSIDLVFDIVGWKPKKVERDLTKPQGVASRAADPTRALKTLGFSPCTSYCDGFKKTIDWYFATKNPREVKKSLDKLLMER